MRGGQQSGATDYPILFFFFAFLTFLLFLSLMLYLYSRFPTTAPALADRNVDVCSGKEGISRRYFFACVKPEVSPIPLSHFWISAACGENINFALPPLLEFG